MKYLILAFLGCGICCAAADDKPSVPPPVPDEINLGTYHDYKGCKLIKVEADGITISHHLGVAKILFDDLPPEMRKAYGYNQEAAEKAMADQAARNAASDAATEKLRIAAQIKALQDQVDSLQKQANALAAQHKAEGNQ